MSNPRNIRGTDSKITAGGHIQISAGRNVNMKGGTVKMHAGKQIGVNAG